jgi:hypothetical protein
MPVAVNTPEKRDPLAKIAQLLSIGQSVMGIKSDIEQSKIRSIQLAQAEKGERKSKGIFTRQEAADEFMVPADSPYYKHSTTGQIEDIDPNSGEKVLTEFSYVPEERLKKLKISQDMDEQTQKAQLEREYTQGRISPKDIAGAVQIVKGDQPPAQNAKSKGWVEKWDIDSSTGKQFKTWVLPGVAASYFASQEKAATEADKTNLKIKTDLAGSFDKIAPAITSMKILDKALRSEDPNAPVPGADALISVLNQRAVLDIIGRGEVWKDPSVLNKFVQRGGPEAQKLWQEISNYMNDVLFAKSGQAVTENEFARQMNALGAHAFTSVQALKNGLNNAKAVLHDTVKTKESGYFDQGKPSSILQEYRKAPGSISSDDPFFGKLRDVKKEKTETINRYEKYSK